MQGTGWMDRPRDGKSRGIITQGTDWIAGLRMETAERQLCPVET
jgi:hypothetical protein